MSQVFTINAARDIIRVYENHFKHQNIEIFDEYDEDEDGSPIIATASISLDKKRMIMLRDELTKRIETMTDKSGNEIIREQISKQINN